MDASFHVRPFAFDRIFGVPEGERRRSSPLELELEVESLRTELERMRGDREAEFARARADGFEAGLAQARGEREMALLAAVDSVQASFEAADEELSDLRKSLTSEATQIAIAAADVIAGRALAHAPELVIDEALGRVLEQVARGTQIVVRVHPGLAAELEELLAARQSRDRRQLSIAILPDAAVAPGDAAMLWDEGGLVLDAGSRRQTVMEELAPLIQD